MRTHAPQRQNYLAHWSMPLPLSTPIVGHRPLFLAAWRFCTSKAFSNHPAFECLAGKFTSTVRRFSVIARCTHPWCACINHSHGSCDSFEKKRFWFYANAPLPTITCMQWQVTVWCQRVCAMGGRIGMGIKHCERRQATLTHLEKNRARTSLPTVVLEKRWLNIRQHDDQYTSLVVVHDAIVRL